jgi:thiol-disulfide isomerase/thioredoxin
MERHGRRPGWSLLARTVCLTLVAALAIVAVAQGAPPEDEDAGAAPTQVHVYYFWGDGCPVCEQQRAYLAWLQERYPEVVVHAFEVWFAVPNRDLLVAFSDAFAQAVTAVPVTFIGDHGWVGFGQVSSLQMTDVVEANRREGGPDAGDRLAPELLRRFLDVQD